MLATTPKYKGEEITIGEKKYILPVLPYIAYDENEGFEEVFAIMEAVDKFLKNPLENPIPRKVFADAKKYLLLGLKRNYPDIDEQEFNSSLTAGSAIRAAGQMVTQEIKEHNLIMSVNEKNVEPQTEAESQAK